MTTTAPRATSPEAGQPAPRHPSRAALRSTAVIAVVVLALFFLPPPDGVDPRGTHMLAIFVGTVLGLVLQPLPSAPVALIGLTAAMVTGAMDPGTEALQGFSNATVWLIVAAFFIADGFLVTGLGRRIALLFITRLGRSSVGLSYGLALTDLVLAPATPSNTARNGGVVYPIISSLSRVQGSTPDDDASRKRLGAYLALTSVQVNVVTSAMFLTAMAGNPVAQSIAAKAGVEVTWGGWALAALVPGLASLALVPWLMARVYGPTLRETPDAPAEARAELARIGGTSRQEVIMIAVFGLLLVLWCLGGEIGFSATAAAFLGVSLLLVTGVLSWKQLAANSSAWQTLVFFAVLVGMADQLAKLGVVDWVGASVSGAVGGLGWVVALVALALVYFYVHYLFASNTAQVVAMYGVFLGAAVAAGAPALLAALVLGFVGNLFGGISHYASGPAGVVFGSGYVTSTEWFRVGFVMGLALLLVWGVLGSVWWKVLGLW